MADPDAVWNRPQPESYWRRVGAALPMRTALLAVAAVWILGCVWSFHEQSAFAAAKGFDYPYLLPLVIDGFAISMAGVAWAASLDARPAVAARLATLVAVAASSTSNGVWAYLRANHDIVTVVLGVAVPVAANLAFEVLLAELRRQVQRRRGLPPPVPVPFPRMIRIVLAPWQTFKVWRRTVLEITATEHQISRPPVTDQPVPPARDVPPAPIAAEATVEPVHRPTEEQRAERPPALAEPTHERQAIAAERAAAPALEHSYERTEPRYDHQPTRPVASPIDAPPVRPVPHSAPEPVAEPVRAQAAVYAPVEEAPARPVTRPTPTRSAPAQPAAHPGPSAPATSRVTAPAAVPTRPRPVVASSNGTSTHGSANGSANGSSTNGSNGSATNDSNGRPIDPRVEQLAKHLASADDADEFTGEMVGPLLNIDVAPRTGRRLLGQARELVSQRAEAEAEAHGQDTRLSVIGRR